LKGLTDRHVAFGVRRSVAELGGATVTPQQYETVRARLVAERRLFDGALLAGLLPTAAQVEYYCGGWDGALVIAELEPAPSPARGKRSTAASAQPAGVPAAEALAFYAAIKPTDKSLWATDDLAERTQRAGEAGESHEVPKHRRLRLGDVRRCHLSRRQERVGQDRVPPGPDGNQVFRVGRLPRRPLVSSRAAVSNAGAI
jgi:hypothetical protein